MSASIRTRLQRVCSSTCHRTSPADICASVYDPDMPQTLPPLLVFRRLVHQLVSIVIFSIRAVMVTSIWLVVLPLATVWTWHYNFAIGESLYVVTSISCDLSHPFCRAFWVGELPNPSTATSYHLNYNWTYPYNFTSPEENPTLFKVLITHPVWTDLSSDIFTGQIIAALIVLTFIAVFLLREWVSQNARPGLFEDPLDAPLQVEAPAPQHNLPLLPAVEVQPPPPEPEQAPAALGQFFDREAVQRLAEQRERRNHAERRRRALQPRIRRRGSGKGVDREEQDPDAHTPVRRRLKLRQNSDSRDDVPVVYRDWNRTLRAAQDEARLRRAAKQPPLEIRPEEAKFTFTARLPDRQRESIGSKPASLLAPSVSSPFICKFLFCRKHACLI